MRSRGSPHARGLPAEAAARLGAHRCVIARAGESAIIEARTRKAFLALILMQAAHSVEEYVFALYDAFAPARFASGLVSSDLSLGFAVLNAGIVAFGAWCYLARVRPGRASAPAWMWPWVLVELGNGILHSTMAVVRGGYFPGVGTAPVLFVLAAFIAAQLLRARPRSLRGAAGQGAAENGRP